MKTYLIQFNTEQLLQAGYILTTALTNPIIVTGTLWRGGGLMVDTESATQLGVLGDRDTLTWYYSSNKFTTIMEKER